MHQNDFIPAAKFLAAQHRILCRSTHIEPGDDVKDFFSHLNRIKQIFADDRLVLEKIILIPILKHN